jgi:hypothetical protein
MMVIHRWPLTSPRHCEERSDEAIRKAAQKKQDCFASLAMTVERTEIKGSRGADDMAPRPS